MKKIRFYVTVITLAVIVSLCAGCGKKSKDNDTSGVASSTDASDTDSNGPSTKLTLKKDEIGTATDINIYGSTDMVINELTGEWIDKKLYNQRPLAVMINNIDAAIPQSGIATADVTYEMIAEGGITRLMCLFKDYENLPKLGSVRSSRQYFVEVANMHNAIYAHIGYSPLAKKEINSSGINNLDGLTGVVSSVMYYRDNSRYAPHNCYTDGKKIIAGIEAAGYSREYTKANDKMLNFNSEDTALKDGETANTVTVGYNSWYVPYFEYNADEKVYYRYEYGGPHIDEYDNTHLSYKNIIIVCADYTIIDDGRNLLDFESGGQGFYATDGRYIEITWKKDNGVLKYYGADGKEIRLNPGKSFIEIFDDSNMGGLRFE